MFLKIIRLKITQLFFLSAILFGFASCGPRNPEALQKIEVGDTFYYWESTADSTPGDAMKNLRNFKKLEDKTVVNLRNVLGRGEHYVWVKFDFTIPEYFRGQPLMLVVPHMKTAARLWINGTLISQVGNFPPHTQSTLFKSHFFSFPVNLLNNEPGATNTVLIKIYALGKSGISSHSYLQPPQYAFFDQEIINFHHTRIYIFLVGTLVFTFVLFMSQYLCLPKFKEYRDFAFINLSTLFFLLPFFATELPIYNSGRVPFLPFTKMTYCIPAFCTVAFATHFAFNFMQTKQPLWIKIIRTAIIVIQIGTTIAMPTYDSLVDMTPFLGTLLLIHGGIAVVLVVINYFRPEHRKLALLFTLGFTPVSLTAIIDIARRLHDYTQTYTFLTLFGWLFSIVAFIITLSVRFSKTYARNEQLTNHLQEEVDSRTHDLQGANYELSLLNERLEREKFIADMDLQMASLVQQRFFPQPNKHFKGWEISVYYSPQAKVSGDLYDYYSYNEILNGLSLFDVSGHGISASLVTMLSKNIISHAFQKGFREKQPLQSILSKINNIILYEKGDIDNYMTGIICRFGEIQKDQTCRVEVGNAGHPYPLKFSANDNEVSEIQGTDGKKHFGAIGMQGIAVSFATSDLTMETGDILMCYTDGLTESTNRSLHQYGTDKIKELIKENKDKSAADILQIITKNFYDFTEGKEPEDDITIIIAKRADTEKYVPDNDREEETIIEPNSDHEEYLEELSPAD